MNDVNVNPSFNKQQNIRELCLKGCSSPSNTQVGGIKLLRKIPTAITYSIYIIAMFAASDNEILKSTTKKDPFPYTKTMRNGKALGISH